MARPVERIPVKGQKKAQPSYPWNEWLDGRVWELRPNHDFSCSTTKMKEIIFKEASRRGDLVDAKIRNGRVYMQKTGYTRSGASGDYEDRLPL